MEFSHLCISCPFLNLLLVHRKVSPKAVANTYGDKQFISCSQCALVHTVEISVMLDNAKGDVTLLKRRGESAELQPGSI